MSTTIPSDDEILERLRGIIAKSLKIEPEQIGADSYLDDLGAESLDLVEIDFDCEEEFRVLMPEKNVLETAEQVFGKGTLLNNGFLTEEGKRFLQYRIPEYDLSKHEGPVPVADVQRAFLRVGAWVRMIRGLIEANPRECSNCGTVLVSATQSRRTCPGCAAEYELIPGEEVNRTWVEAYYKSEYLPALAARSASPAVASAGD